jgi:hypothetical protein
VNGLKRERQLLLQIRRFRTHIECWRPPNSTNAAAICYVRFAQRPVIPEVLWGARAALEALDIKTRDSG